MASVNLYKTRNTITMACVNLYKTRNTITMAYNMQAIILSHKIQTIWLEQRMKINNCQ
jgi:hypothetical protein